MSGEIFYCDNWYMYMAGGAGAGTTKTYWIEDRDTVNILQYMTQSPRPDTHTPLQKQNHPVQNVNSVAVEGPGPVVHSHKEKILSIHL